MEYKIVNREPNIARTQLVYTRNNISGVDRSLVDKMDRVFSETRNIGKEKVSSSELRDVSERIRKEHLAKVRVLKKEENKGFVIIGSLTLGTILLLTFLIVIKRLFCFLLMIWILRGIRLIYKLLF